MPTRADRREGFSVIELIAALALTALVLLGARGLLNGLGAGSAALQIAAARDAAHKNGDRLLRDLVRHAYESQDTSRRFIGTALSAEFESWCLVGDGWLEPCRMALRLESHADSSKLHAEVHGKSLTLWRARGEARFAYFEAGHGWQRSWTNALVVPSAVGILTSGDTIVLPLGAAR